MLFSSNLLLLKLSDFIVPIKSLMHRSLRIFFFFFGPYFNYVAFFSLLIAQLFGFAPSRFLNAKVLPELISRILWFSLYIVQPKMIPFHTFPSTIKLAVGKLCYQGKPGQCHFWVRFFWTEHKNWFSLLLVKSPRKSSVAPSDAGESCAAERWEGVLWSAACSSLLLEVICSTVAAALFLFPL